jgi:hypothetical protein
MPQNKRSVNISLQEKDKDILLKIADAIGSTGYLYTKKKYSDAHQQQYKLVLYSRHLCESLCYYNVVPNKSLILEFPKTLPIKYYSHLLRGYLDGDGNISNYNDRFKQVRIVSTYNFCNDAKFFIETALKINCSIKNCKNCIITKELEISGRNQCEKFLNWIYKDANLYIQRKYDTYRSMFNINNSDQSNELVS